VANQRKERGLLDKKRLRGLEAESAPTGYQYGWPSGGTSEPDVIEQFVFDVASGNLTGTVLGTTLTPTGSPTFEVDSSSYSPSMAKSIKYGSNLGHRVLSAQSAFDRAAGEDFTIEWVARRPSTDTGFCASWSLNGAASTTAYGIIVYHLNATGLSFYFRVEDGSYVGADWTIPNHADDTFHKYRLVADRSGNAELFFDGVSKGTAAMASVNAKGTVNTAVRMGEQYNSGGDNWPGELVEWRMSGNLTNNSGGPGGG